SKWLRWINRHLPRGYKWLEESEALGTYDYGSLVEGIVSRDVVDAFWKQPDLYNLVEPMEGAMDALWRVKHKHNFEVVFASHVEGEHGRSKLEFLRKYFPVDGFVATRQKNYIRASIVVDD